MDFLLCLIGNAHAAGQIQAQLNAALLGSHTVLVCYEFALLKRIISKVSENADDDQETKQAEYAFSFVVLHLYFSFIPYFYIGYQIFPGITNSPYNHPTVGESTKPLKNYSIGICNMQ